MTPDERYRIGLDEYLAAGPAELSDRVIWAVRAELPTTHQRRRPVLRVPAWRTPMSTSTKLLLTAAAALAVLVGASGLLGRLAPPGPGADPTPSPSSEPSSSASPTPAPSPELTFTAPIVGDSTAIELEPVWTVDGRETTFWTPAIAPDGRIWVPANELDVFRIYDQDGNLDETWGTPGTGDGQFRFGDSTDRDGAGIVFAPDGSFYVLDSSNFRVQRFSGDRTFLASFGEFGSGDGQFVSPLAIGLDDGGNLYVSDDGRNDVQVFTTEGTYVRTVAVGAAGDGLWGSGPGWFVTTRRTDDGPGVMEYHDDGTVQGGWNLMRYDCEPSGVTRDEAPRNIYITCPDMAGSGGHLFRFDEGGLRLRTWAVGGLGIAVTPDGTAAFVISNDQTQLVRYDLDPPG